MPSSPKEHNKPLVCMYISVYDPESNKQAERNWIILATFNCTAHGRVRHHQLPKMADALFVKQRVNKLNEFVGSFSLVCAFVQL